MYSQVPAGITRLFKNPFLDWNLETTKESKSMGNVGSYIARGKLLGGSSSTNATLYHRGTAQDYDSWGLKGWGSQDVLPWFKCAEDNPAFKGSEYHNTGALAQLACLACLQFVSRRHVEHAHAPGQCHAARFAPHSAVTRPGRFYARRRCDARRQPDLPEPHLREGLQGVRGGRHQAQRRLQRLEP